MNLTYIHFFIISAPVSIVSCFRVPPYSSGPLPTPQQQPPSLGLPSTTSTAATPITAGYAPIGGGAHFYGGGGGGGGPSSQTQTRPHSTIFSSSTLPSPRRRAAALEKTRREAEAAAAGGGGGGGVSSITAAVSLEGVKAELRMGQDGAKPQNVSDYDASLPDFLLLRDCVAVATFWIHITWLMLLSTSHKGTYTEYCTLKAWPWLKVCILS